MKQIHLAAHFPGVNNTTVWSDPEAGSNIAFASFEHLARTAERAKFDFLFLAEGLRMREHDGRLHDLDVAGRPDGFTVLAALAAVTRRLGLVATITTTYHEADELARALGTLDVLSDGRAGWNLVTSSDAFTGANFRRGPYLAYEDRYARGTEVLDAVQAAWDTWPGGLPQRRPVMIQAGDSEAGREFAAARADGIFTRHGTLADGQAFTADVKGRLGRHGRRPADLLILPGATFVLGDTDAEAAELEREVRLAQVSGAASILFLEQLWNRDLSAYDPDGPLPAIDPDVETEARSQGSAQARSLNRDAVATAARWRERAQAGGLSIRELVIEMTARQTFVGSAASIAASMDAYVQSDACDGFILVPSLTPSGLDRFADEVVPLLQERGSFRADYDGPTLRDHLGLAMPPVVGR